MTSVGRQIAALPRPVRFPVWVRHHWIAVEVSTERTRVFDSAASQVVRNDMRRFADRQVYLGCPLRMSPSSLEGPMNVGYLPRYFYSFSIEA